MFSFENFNNFLFFFLFLAKIVLVPVDGNEQQLCTEELTLYNAYQTFIHAEVEPDASSFTEFLINSPLKVH